MTRPRGHWVCFDCRKQFRRLARWDGDRRGFPFAPLRAAQRPCPECKAPMVDMGVHFRPPRRADTQAWEQMRLHAMHRVCFRLGDAAAYQRLVTDFHPRLRRTKRSLAAFQCHPLTEGQCLLQKIARDRERHGMGR